MVDYKGEIEEKGDTKSKSDHSIIAVINRSALNIASDPKLFMSLVSSLTSWYMNVSVIKSRARKVRVSAKELSEWLKMILDMSQKIIKAITHRPRG